MNQQNWVYLSQLTRALQVEGVEGLRAGEFVAEINSHLEETGGDPVEEFGTPFELATELARRPGSRRPGWVPPLWAAWLLGLILVVMLTAAVDAVTGGWDEAGIPIRGWGVAFGSGIYLMSMVGMYLSTWSIDGRSWAALTDRPFVLFIVIGSIVTTSAASAFGDREIALVPVATFWGTVMVVVPLLLYVVIKRNNPVRFPRHARHLRRLKWGPLAGKAPTDPARSE